MIEAVALTKRYGAKTALDNVSFSVAANEVVGLLGLNGAGKTTTMNILAGYLGASSGTVKIAGYDVVEDSMEARKLVGYLPEQPPLYLDMTVEEYLRFVFKLYRLGGSMPQRISRVAELTGIADVRARLIRNLSKGYRQRVGIAQAVLPEPKVLILDEPTVGLDPTQIIEIRQLIREVARDTTVILSSHILTEVQAVCSRILVLHRGKLVADDTGEGLAEQMHGKSRVTARAKGTEAEVLAALRQIPGLVRLESLGAREIGTTDFVCEGADGRDLRVDVFVALAAAGLPLLYTYGSECSLEEVFLRVIEGNAGGERS